MKRISITNQLIEISRKKIDGNSLISDTDSKANVLYYHFIALESTDGSVYVTYTSDYAYQYTIATLKTALAGKSVVCNGYLDGSVAQYISGEAGGLTVGVIDLSDGSTEGKDIDNTFSISDKVTLI